MVSSLVKRDLKKILECFCLLAYLYNALFSSLCSWVLVAQSCLTLCDPMDCSPPGSSVHGIFWARILEWIVIPFFRGSF